MTVSFVYIEVSVQIYIHVFKSIIFYPRLIICFVLFFLILTYTIFQAIIHSYSFVIFGVLLIFFGIFIKFFVPETKGKSIDEIVHMFEQQYIFN